MIEVLPLIDARTMATQGLSGNGVYFFYEAGESQSHDSGSAGIVRVGISSDTGGRIEHHYHGAIDIDQITLDTFCPKDRSIMRKHIGRALLNTPAHPHASYYDIWNKDLTTAAARSEFRERRVVSTERAIETQVSQYMMSAFRFQCIPTPTKELAKTIERQCIAILSSCPACQRSADWLGRNHPNSRIAKGTLWNIQGVTDSYRGPYPFHELERLITQRSTEERMAIQEGLDALEGGNVRTFEQFDQEFRQ